MANTSRSKTAQRIFLIIGAVALAEWWIRVTLQINRQGEEAFFIDFVAFWTAGRLALEQTSMMVWDQVAFAAAQLAPRAEGVQMPWFYPPTWHLLVTPLGLLPFSIAWLCFIALSLFVYIRALSRVAPGLWVGLLVCPTVLLTLMLGNNSVLFAGCLALALHRMAIRPGKGMIAGGLVALLSAKPGLGPLIPVALAAGGRWRVILWAALGALTLAGWATLFFGIGYWQAFFDGLQIAMGRVTEGSNDAARMISWFALAKHLGAEAAALSLHLGLLAATGIALALVWRKGAAHWPAASLMCAVALTSPHAFHYELVFAMAGMGFALRAGLGWVGKGVLALLWISPLPLLLPFELMPIVLIASPAASLALGYCLWRGLRG